MSKGNKVIEWIVNENGCYICISHSKNQNGYPLYKWNGNRSHMSRYIYEQNYGTIPYNMVVLHKCDNRACINPEHLTLGTQNDNMQDMKNKNRHYKGEQHWKCKLSREKVLSILKDERTQKEIAKDYGIARSTVGMIKSGKLWNWLGVA